MRLPRALPAVALIAVLALPLTAPQAQQAEPSRDRDWQTIVGLPGQAGAVVDATGALREDWGMVRVRLGAAKAPAAPSPADVGIEEGWMPMATAVTEAGPIRLRTVAFLAPCFPDPADAIRATVANVSPAPAEADITLDLPELPPEAAMTRTSLALGPRVLAALPPYGNAVLPERDWGCSSAAAVLPGWARPGGPCDPAFANIRVGWRGEPIIYRFRVQPGAQATVVLGMCESHWDQAGQRPLILEAEGAPDRPLDAIAELGRHVPACIKFDARDADSDGRIDVGSYAAPGAPDNNCILNAIWVFPPDPNLNLDAVKRGNLNSAATYYVDCGGERDQLLHPPGDVTYRFSLGPGATESLTFLFARPGVQAPAAPRTPDEASDLFGSAKSLWTEWAAKGWELRLPDAELTSLAAASLANIMVARGQAEGFHVARSSALRADSFSSRGAARIIAALDVAGHHREAEQCLRMFWDKPLPSAIAAWGQKEDGRWDVPEGDWCGHYQVLWALAQHYRLTGDRAWLARAYPAAKRGAEWIRHPAGGDGDTEATTRYERDFWAFAALEGAAEMARALGHEDDAAWMAAEAADISASLSPTLARALEAADPSLMREAGLVAASGDAEQARLWLSRQARGDNPDALAGANCLLLLRALLVADRADGGRPVLRLPADWVADGGSLRASNVPTARGPISIQARYLADEDTLQIGLEGPALAAADSILFHPPAIGGRPPKSAHVNGQPVPLDAAGTIGVPAAQGRVVVTVRYR